MRDDERRDGVLQLRVTTAELRELQDAAGRDGETLSEWVRARALRAARRSVTDGKGPPTTPVKG